MERAPNRLTGFLVMDTTEEINGSYYYHGHPNVTPGELYDLIFIEQRNEGLDNLR